MIYIQSTCNIGQIEYCAYYSYMYIPLFTESGKIKATFPVFCRVTPEIWL